MPQIMVHANVLKVGETQKVTSSSTEVNWKQAANMEKADVISIVMDLNYVNELRNGTNGYWRFASSEGVQKLIDMGKPDTDGHLYFKIVREGENRGIYCIPEIDWRRVTSECSLTIHVPSIKKAIKENRPLAVIGDGYLDRDRHWLGVGGYYYEDYVVRVAQVESAREAGAPKSVDVSELLRVAEELENRAKQLRKMAENS